MQKILEDIATPEWWFSVVIASLIVGVVGVYLTRFLDGAGKKLLTVLAMRGEEAVRKREEKIQFYSQHADLVPFLIARQQDMRASRTNFVAFSLFPLLIAIVTTISGFPHSHPTAARIVVAISMLAGALILYASIWASRISFNDLLIIMRVEQELVKRKDAAIAESAADR